MHAPAMFQLSLLMFLAIWCLAIPCPAVIAEDKKPLGYELVAKGIHQELSPEFCWFHPRVAALPGYGKEGQPAVIVTLQKHLAASDHFSGLFVLRTDDLGRTWTGPTEIPELGWRQDGDTTVAVIDVTPGWHPQTGTLIAIGAKTLYSKTGDILRTAIRSYETSYAVYNPRTNRWTKWRELAVPDTETKFYGSGCGCSQWLVQPDGKLLLPVQYYSEPGGRWRATMVQCQFDGTDLTYLKHGDELEVEGGYGYAEPSLIAWHGKYFLTLRHEHRADVTVSDDGLHFQPAKPWTFDDGEDLGNYNTQTHWLAHQDGLLLIYTRRGANNDHVRWNRAPLFIAEVDPEKLQVLRRTEKVLFPDRGVMYGNFGANPITPQESWVTDADLITPLIDPDAGKKPHPRGGDGTVWLGRVKWTQPNQLVK